MESLTADFELTWPMPPDGLELADGEIQVWSARLLGPHFHLPAGLALLTEDEKKRAGKFHFEQDRRNFVARRSFLRSVLGIYLKIEPSRVSLAYEERGKPHLSEANGAPEGRLHFNFSQSRNLALMAVCRGRPVGADVEKIRPMPELDEIAATFCSPGERERIKAVASEQKLEVFFDIWTRKEAYLKGTGEGIAGALAEIDCWDNSLPWSFHSLSPAAGFTGTVAVGGEPAELQCWQWAADSH